MALEKRLESPLRLTSRDWKYLGLLSGAIFLVFWDVFFLQKAFLSGDHLIQHYPWAKFLQDSIRQFRLPWWTSQIQSGLPLLAEGQIGAFYPLNLLFLFFLPLRWAYSYEVLFHFLLGGVFFYLYVRRLKLSREAAFFSTFIFLFGSCEGGFFYNITSQRVSIWFPLSLLLVEKLFERESLRPAFLLGFVFAFQIFAGYLQISIYCVALTTFYFLLRLIPFFKEGSPASFSRSILGFGVAGGLGLFLSAVQWVPTLRLSMFSARAEAREALAYMGSPNPFFFTTLLFPDWTGLWGGGIYVGLLGLFFFLWALFSPQSGRQRLWLLIFIISFLLALGQYSPLYIFLVKALKLYFFRVPTKFLFFASFALAVLAGYGLDQFLQRRKNFKILRRVSATMITLFLVILISIGTAHFVGKIFRAPLLGFLERYVAQKIYGQPYHPHSFEIYQERLHSYYEQFLYFTTLHAPQTWFPLLLFLIQAGILTLLFKKARPRPMTWVFLLLLFTDLFCYAHMNTRRDLVSYGIVETKSRLVQKAREDPDIFRIHEFNTGSLQAEISPTVPNQNMLYNLEDIGVYSPFAFVSYKNFLDGLGGVNDSLYQNPTSLEALQTHRAILNHLNVKYVFSNVPLEIKGLEKVDEERGIGLYKNNSFWPRAFYTGRLSPSLEFGSIRKVPILKREEGRILLDTRGLGEGFVLVSEQNYPGWKVRREAEILEPLVVGEGLKAVQIFKETDEIEFLYEERDKKTLFWISAGSFLLGLVGVWKTK